MCLLQQMLSDCPQIKMGTLEFLPREPSTFLSGHFLITHKDSYSIQKRFLTVVVSLLRLLINIIIVFVMISLAEALCVM